jgi:uncharacterized protein
MTNMASAQRHTSLDAIRGFAVMGILAMNIAAFALPFSAYFNPAAGGPPSTSDTAIWAFNFVLVDSKMRGLFSMLFGASTLLVIERAAASGQGVARKGAAASHYPRMAWLFVFGLVHFYLIWPGDILILYAACGLLLYLFRNLSVRGLLIWAAVFFLITQLYFTGAWWLFVQGQAGNLPPEAQAGLAKGLKGLTEEMGANSPVYAAQLALYGGGAAGIYGERFGALASLPFVQILQFLWETMALMLIGMALYKSRMLTGEWDARRYRTWVITCFLLAVPPLAALVHYQVSSGFGTVETFGASFALSMPFDFILTVGWAAAIMLAIKTMLTPAAVARLAATGQMAFTNYLATSVIMVLIFYGFGLGLFGRLDRAGLYLVCIAMWTAMLLWSQPWLARHPYGPLEWAWRSLARGERQKWTH